MGPPLTFAQTSTQVGRDADNRRCTNCHGQQRIASLGEADRRMMVATRSDQPLPTRSSLAGLFVDDAARTADVHRELACISCHVDASTLPHPASLAKPVCASCHPSSADSYIQGVHAAAARDPSKKGPNCWDCHGTHDIRRKSDPAASTFPTNIITTCAGCHQQHHGTTTAGADEAEWVTSYLDSVHGRAVSKAGLAVAATCADCHGHHDVRPSTDPQSLAHRTRVAETCGRCHVGINETFAGSVHAQAAKNPKPDRMAPVCTDCHSSHAITRVDTPAVLRDIANECGTCHADLYHTYRQSYHGQASSLGSERAARCSDCHGAHNILPPDDPHSTLAAARRADTCAVCHTELRTMSATGRANFVAYSPHANYRDRKKDPILYFIWLYFMVVMGVTFAFWGLHSLAWYVRGAILRVRQGPHPRHHPTTHGFQRFSTWHRVTHGMVIVSFLGLTLTGLPLKFSDEPWARRAMTAIGGPETAGSMHRFFAVLVLIYLGMHAVHLWRSYRDGRDRSLLGRIFGPNSMLPMPSDWRQFKQMVKWFLGRGPRPKFDRWTYWEKFDYWADLFGTTIIGLSGLMLWFPAIFAEYLSGYWFNIATVVHGYEALLAAGFIFTIHFFNGHLRWEKFPVDTVIFTGQISEEEFKEERPLQYERLKEQGALDALRVAPAPHWLRRLSVVIGLAALVIGTALVAAIIWTAFR